MVGSKIKIGVFISGGGSNLQALIDACSRDEFPAEIAVVFSNKADAYGLERARKAGIPTEFFSHKDDKFESKLLKALTDYQADIICLAGFMRILSANFISAWGRDMLNIHPSLLPKYKGLNTHQRAINSGDSEAGCSVHHVVPEMDSGEIIVQRRVSVLDGDTADSLAFRVLEQEHIAYVEAVEIIAKKLHNDI